MRARIDRSHPRPSWVDPALNSPFKSPAYLAFDSARNLWVRDFGIVLEFGAADIASASGVEMLDAGWVMSGVDDYGGLLIDPTPVGLPLAH